MADDQQPQQPQQPAQPDYQAILQALIQRQLLTASGQGQQVQLPPTPQAQTQYSNDPSKGPDLLARIGLAIGGGSLPGAPAELRQQMGKQALLNFGIGLLGAGRFSTPGEALAGGLKGAQSGLLGSEAAQAGQQEYALGSREKLAELGLTQQKNQTEALASILPLIQMGGRLGLPPLFGGGAGAPGGGGPGGGLQFTGDPDKDLPMVAQHESGGDPTALNYVAKADPSAYDRGATASGKYGIVNSTWSEGKQLAGIDPAKYPTARSAPEKVQDQVAQAIYAKYGSAPWDASKFPSNWVQQPGGGYQLVKGAPPPASGPGSAVGPYKPQPPGTAAAPSAPPGVQMGGQPPPPPGGAGGDYSGGGIGTVLKTGTAAAPPPTGKRAAADAILQGIQTAEATPVVRGTGQEAGPSGAVATLAQPATAQPGWGAKVGSYDFGGPVGPLPTPPVVAQPPAEQQPTPAPTPQPPAPTPKPASRAQDYSVPDTGLDGEEFMSRHFVPATAAEVKTYAPGPTSDEAAAAADQVQRERANVAAQQTQLDQIRRGQMPGDVTKQAAQVTDAQKALDAAQNTYNEQVQKLAQSGATNLLSRDNAERARVSADYKTQVIDPKNAAALSAQQHQQAIELENVRTGNATSQKLQEAYNTDAANSGKRIDDLELLRGLSDNAGTPTLLTNIKVGDRSLADIISATGFGGKDLQDKVGAVQAFRAGILNTVRELRSGGAATGEPRSNQDLQFVQDMAPNEWQSPATRGAIISFLQQVNQRRIDMAAEISRLTATRGANGQLMPAGEAVAQARKNLPDFVQTMPPETMGNTPAAQQARKDWFATNVPPHTFFRYPNGRIDLYNGPGGQ